VIICSGVAVARLGDGPSPGGEVPVAGGVEDSSTLPSETRASEKPGQPERSRKKLSREEMLEEARGYQDDLMGESASFRFGLFDIVAEYLDPAKTYLNYSTRSVQSSTDASGVRTLGIKLGWKVPGEPGEGLVQIAVSDLDGPDRPRCGEFTDMVCREVRMPNGESVEYGEEGDGTFDVEHRRADGTTVHVRVDPLFGNNSLVPVEEMRIDHRDVMRLVQDERIQLPEL
jgi:hypothetical protein